MRKPPPYNDEDFTPLELAELIVITEYLRVNMPEQDKTDRHRRDSRKEDQ